MKVETKMLGWSSPYPRREELEPIEVGESQKPQCICGQYRSPFLWSGFDRGCWRKPENPGIFRGVERRQDGGASHTHCPCWDRKARVFIPIVLSVGWRLKIIRTLGTKTSFFSDKHQKLIYPINIGSPRRVTSRRSPINPQMWTFFKTYFETPHVEWTQKSMVPSFDCP